MTALCEHTTEIMSIGGERGQKLYQKPFFVDRIAQQIQDKTVLLPALT